MGLFDWFKRKPGPKVVGTSKGGSRLMKYDKNSGKPRIGFTEESTMPLMEERERIYTELFGEPDVVFHELMPLVPHIDVYRYLPQGERDFVTYVTGGMSDLPMSAPNKFGPEVKRAELVFYAKEHRDEYPEFLRFLAHFPHDNQTWLHWGHSMPNGQPPQPLFGTRMLDSVIFMPSIVAPDGSLGERLIFDSQPVNLVWCVPVTGAECQLKLDKGSEALYDLFDKNQHPVPFAGDRDSYV